MPYDAHCLDYLNVPAESRLIVRLTATPEAVPPAPCPDNDRVPYSASCLAFLKGATDARNELAGDCGAAVRTCAAIAWSKGPSAWWKLLARRATFVTKPAAA